MAFKMKGFSGFKNKSDVPKEVFDKFTNKIKSLKGNIKTFTSSDKIEKNKSKTYSDAGEPGLFRPKKNYKKETLEDFLSKKETKMKAAFPKKQYDSGWDAKAKAQWKTDYRKRNNHKGPIDRKLYPWVNM